jgi:flavodoxin
MMKAAIIYHSKTGITKKYAQEIEAFLAEMNIDVKASSIDDYNYNQEDEAEYHFLGCWTSGLFIFGQHPDAEWVEFASKLHGSGKSKIVLFTTYKLLTGSMFRKMRKHLNDKFILTGLKLKSRNGILSEKDKKGILKIINS